MPLPLLVFTDLDGTLLDHHTYSHADASPALAALAVIGAGVVLASSKTAAEIAPLRAELGLTDWPAIVENGAGVLPPGAIASNGDADYLRLRAALAQLPYGLRAHFTGFGDMSDAEVADLTGLPVKAAALARQRQYSEPGHWSGSPAQEAEFAQALARQHISARSGGRFLTLSYGATKADRMAEITAKLAPDRTVALGDAPNDIEMLAAADTAFIVANPDATPLPPQPSEATGRIRRTKLPGPSGWNAAILGLVCELANQQERS